MAARRKYEQIVTDAKAAIQTWGNIPVVWDALSSLYNHFEAMPPSADRDATLTIIQNEMERSFESDRSQRESVRLLNVIDKHLKHDRTTRNLLLAHGIEPEQFAVHVYTYVMGSQSIDWAKPGVESWVKQLVSNRAKDHVRGKEGRPMHKSIDDPSLRLVAPQQQDHDQD